MMMMMMMPRLQKWGSFFLPLKQNLSLSFSRAQNTQPRAREELLPRREWRPLSDLSLLLLLLRKSAQRAQVLLLSCKNKSCCFSLFCLLGKMKLSLQKNCSFTVSGLVCFFVLFLILSFWEFVLALFLPAFLNAFFNRREDEKVDRHPTPSSLDCCGKTLFFLFFRFV